MLLNVWRGLRHTKSDVIYGSAFLAPNARASFMRQLLITISKAYLMPDESTLSARTFWRQKCQTTFRTRYAMTSECYTHTTLRNVVLACQLQGIRAIRFRLELLTGHLFRVDQAFCERGRMSKCPRGDRKCKRGNVLEQFRNVVT